MKDNTNMKMPCDINVVPEDGCNAKIYWVVNKYLMIWAPC